MSAQFESQAAKIAGLERTLEAKANFLKDAEAAIAVAMQQSQNYQEALHAANTQVYDLNLEKNSLAQHKEALQKQVEALTRISKDNDEMIARLQNDSSHLVEKNKQDLDAALANLMLLLEEKRDEDLAKLRAQKEQLLADKMAEKAQEIFVILAGIDVLKASHASIIEDKDKLHSGKIKVMEDRIKDVTEEREEFSSKLEDAKITIKERCDEIDRQLGVIDVTDVLNKDLEAKTLELEADKSDAYQKMMAIDSKVRHEMTERFDKEKMEINRAT